MNEVAEPKNSEEEYLAAAMEEMPDRQCTKLPAEAAPAFTISQLPKNSKPQNSNNIKLDPKERIKPHAQDEDLNTSKVDTSFEALPDQMRQF